jgi:hypothetical protein
LIALSRFSVSLFLAHFLAIVWSWHCRAFVEGAHFRSQLGVDVRGSCRKISETPDFSLSSHLIFRNDGKLRLVMALVIVG